MKMNDVLGQLAECVTPGSMPPGQAAAHPPDPAQEEFLSSMGHELRNPLTSILAHAEALQEGVYGPLQHAQQTALSAIQQDVRHLLHLVADVIDLSRDTAALSPTHFIPCPLAESCQHSLDRVAALASTRAARLTCDIQPPALSVMADAQKLRQIITELLAAALLTTPAGGQLQLHVRIDGSGHLLLHTHSGPSDPPAPSATAPDAMQPPLLQRLKKLKPIGIALLQKLVHLHHGTHTISASAEHAISMSIRLPLEVLPDAEPAPAVPPPDQHHPPAPAASPSLQTILIADDHPTLVTVARHYLEDLGFHVITARDGAEAVQWATTARPALILMDVRMPVLDGLAAIRQLRASPDPHLHTVPIISLSGIASHADQAECLAAGATAYLSKPFGVHDLDRLIATHLTSQLAETKTQREPL